MQPLRGKLCFKCGSEKIVSSVYAEKRKDTIEFRGWVCRQCLRELERQVLRELEQETLQGSEGTMMFGYEKVRSVRNRGVLGLKGQRLVFKTRRQKRSRASPRRAA